MTPRKRTSPKKKSKEGDAVETPQKKTIGAADADVDRAVLLWEFFIIHGHVDVPHSYKLDRRLARFVHYNKLQRKTLQEIWEDKYEAPDWLKFSSGIENRTRPYKNPPRNYVDIVSSSENENEKDERLRKFIMWLVVFMFEKYNTNRERSSDGLKRFQGVNRGFWQQWIYRIKSSGRKKMNPWIGIELGSCMYFWDELRQIVLKLVNVYLRDQGKLSVELREMMFLTKPSFSEQHFLKHQDAHGNIDSAKFAGAVSLCLAETIVNGKRGGVEVFPKCKSGDQKCSAKTKNICGHKKIMIELKPLECIFIPDKLWHTSVFPEGGTQYNVVFFLAGLKVSGKNTRNNQLTTYKSLKHKKFTADEFKAVQYDKRNQWNKTKPRKRRSSPNQKTKKGKKSNKGK